MAVLKDILYKVKLLEVSGNMEQEVKRITFNSKDVAKGDLFIAIAGTRFDGHHFMQDATSLGAVAVICEYFPAKLEKNVTYVKVDHSAKALGIIAANFYGNPSSKLKLLGVTGTNGKTTAVTLLYGVFSKLGYKTGLISTVANRIGGEVIETTYTTPDSLQINKLLADMVKAGCTHCFMEVSSHAIAQNRVTGLDFDGGIFTNITHEHLDYHGTFEEYIRIKKSFFDGLSKYAFALVNVDDKRGKIMLQNTKARKKMFSLKNIAEYKAKVLSNTFQGLELNINGKEVWFRLVGAFNAYNILAVYGTAVEMGENNEEVLTAISEMDAAPGRFEQIRSSESDITGIVDYAHTPDALKNVLQTIQSIRTGNEKVITVVGCGGDRDKEKRPMMASVACKYSDKVILTSDNPRSEDPEVIISDMQKGVGPVNFKKTLSMVDRKEAIKTACMLAGNSDIILVAGKGHENYQEIKGMKHPFNDKSVLSKMLIMTKH